MSELTLYRGDAEKIKSFQLNKTNNYSLLGPGIYLTDSKKIAESYREKGACQTNNVVLYRGATTKTRTEAYAKAFESFVEHELRLKKNVEYEAFSNVLFKKLPASFLLKMKNLYNDLIEEKVIVASYETHPGKFNWIIVEYFSKEKNGYITEFKFEKEVFEPSILKIDGYLENRSFWDLMWEHKVDVGNEPCFQNKKPLFTYNDYISKNLGSLHSLSFSPFGGRSSFFGKNKVKTLRAIKNALKPNGYKGLEYEGGILIGSHGRHRAFCVWDDEYVNDSLVKRFQ